MVVAANHGAILASELRAHGKRFRCRGDGKRDKRCVQLISAQLKMDATKRLIRRLKMVTFVLSEMVLFGTRIVFHGYRKTGQFLMAYLFCINAITENASMSIICFLELFKTTTTTCATKTEVIRPRAKITAKLSFPKKT